VEKTSKKPEDKSKSDHEPDEEAQNQRAVVRQESRGLQENEIAELVNRYLAPNYNFNMDSTRILTGRKIHFNNTLVICIMS